MCCQPDWRDTGVPTANRSLCWTRCYHRTKARKASCQGERIPEVETAGRSLPKASKGRKKRAVGTSPCDSLQKGRLARNAAGSVRPDAPQDRTRESVLLRYARLLYWGRFFQRLGSGPGAMFRVRPTDVAISRRAWSIRQRAVGNGFLLRIKLRPCA